MIKQQYIDYFKLFKIYDLKKLQKTGQVKIVQDKILMRKILSVEGTVSTENFTTLFCSQHPNFLFKQQYLYLQAFCQPGKAFTLQITYFLSSKEYKLICSTMFKQDFKRKSDTLSHFKLKMPSDKWTIVAIDLYSLVNWDQSFKNDKDLRLGFRISSVEIRAHSKVRGMFQSDVLYGPQLLPKDMELPLRGEESFFDKYSFVVTGLNLTQQVKCEIQKSKQKSKHQPNKQELDQSNNLISDNKNKSLSKKEDDSRKSQSKAGKKSLSREKPQLSQQKVKDNKRPKIPPNVKSENQKRGKKGEISKLEQVELINEDQDLIQEQALQPPRPAASISMKISAIQAMSVVHENIISCESFLIEPVMIQTHKKITHIYKSRLGKVLTSYIDGSVCIWDTIRKQSLFYFRSELQQIKCLLMDYDGNIIIVGLDKLKREVIEIVSQGAIVFKQISNFNIKAIKLISEETFQMGLLSIGYENIRIWTISPNNNIINGYSVYLGKMARNVTYNDCCIIETVAGNYAFVCDSEGYVTKININEKKMEGVVRVDNCGIDHIRLIKYLNNQQKILVATQKGTIKLLSCTTMQSQLEYPLNNRIKSLFLKQNSQHGQVPNLVLQSYNKTLAELDLIDSTFHFSIRSHYQQVSHIEYEKSGNRNSSLFQDKIITAGADSTMRIWKLIKVSDQQTVLKEEYEFLINGETITHICSISSSKQSGHFVYMVTDNNKIRKISSTSYQIVKEKSIPSINENSGQVLSFSINQQGKVLLMVCEDRVILLDQELQVLQLRNFLQEFGTRKVNKQHRKYLSGFNTYKKNFFFQNPFTSSIQFYQLKDISKTLFQIPFSNQQKVISLQWDNDAIHLITQDQYQLFDKDNLLRSIPILTHHQSHSKTQIQTHFTTMNYPLLCKSYQLKQTNQSFIFIQVLNKTGLNQSIKMPEKISHLKITKPIKSQDQYIGSSWTGQIICAGAESFGLYALKYSILNAQDLLSFSDNTLEVDEGPGNFMKGRNQIKQRIIKMDDPNLSFISTAKQQNALDISFSESATLLLGNKNHLNFGNTSRSYQNPPTQLKKLYEQEEKVFEQCKKAVFGNFFKQDEDNQLKKIQDDQENEQADQLMPQNGKIKLKVFFGIEARQSLVGDDEMNKNKKQEKNNGLGDFYWNSECKMLSLLTNFKKSLLIHEFTQPSITQRLLHLYSKPSSICWSPRSESGQGMNYYIICHNSIIKLYNADTRMSYIRSLESDILIKQKHVIFSSFITNCNSFLVVLTYKMRDSSEKSVKEDVFRPKESKLYIFVIEISTSKIVSSSYRQMKHKRSKNRIEYEKSIRQSYELCPNRYTANKQLQFILKGTQEVSFYRVTSMFTLQTLEIQEIHNLTKEKTESLTAANYIKVEGDVYLLIGTENGSVIIIDSRSASIVLVLVNLLSSSSGSMKGECISKIQFVEEQSVDNEVHSFSKLMLFCSGSGSIKVITLQHGLNTLIRQVQTTTSTLSPHDSFSNNHPSTNSSLRSINLDSEITSISCINNTTQQLVITKSSTLWLVDYEDYCSIKIFSAHSTQINQAFLLKQSSNFQNKLFISCSEDGYVKVSDTDKTEQLLEIYKPRKRATCLDVQGNYTVCGFKDQVYFYDVLSHDAKNFSYLGSLQFQNQTLINVRNIPFTDNYYLLTEQKLYIIYVKNKKQVQPLAKSQLSINKSQLSFNSHLQNYPQSSQHSISSKGLNILPKVQIQIEIQEITSFNTQTKSNSIQKPIWLEINPYRPYDQFSIGFKGGKVDTWERKCLKRTLNPLQELSNVQLLQYYLIDVYSRKQVQEPYVQFISEREYMISLSELNQIEVRNYKQHSIIREIAFSQQFFQGIKTFRYLTMPEKKQLANQSIQKPQRYNEQGNQYFNNLSSLRKGPLILIGDQHGYMNICDMNGLVIQKEKVFNSPIESIEVDYEVESKIVAFSVFLKSSHYISLLQVYN